MQGLQGRQRLLHCLHGLSWRLEPRAMALGCQHACMGPCRALSLRNMQHDEAANQSTSLPPAALPQSASACCTGMLLCLATEPDTVSRLQQPI